jgi:hypothetical protein
MRTGIRRLSEQIRRTADASRGVRLASKDVNIVLAALRSATENADANLNGRAYPLQIELLDEEGWPVEVLALFNEELLARAVFNRAKSEKPRRKMRLRAGARVLIDADAK